MNPEIEEIVEFISELQSDSSVPRNVKSKLLEIVKDLKAMSQANMSLVVNKILSNLDDISSDANLDSFTRQQIWSITSMLECLETA
ncbi:MAG: UPF0147 family protein [Candidatus Woesearchaeota archaeon]